MGQATINEVQRLSCVAPAGLEHRALKDTHLYGYFIPKGKVQWWTNVNTVLEMTARGAVCVCV